MERMRDYENLFIFLIIQQEDRAWRRENTDTRERKTESFYKAVYPS